MSLCYDSTVSLARRIRSRDVSPRDAVDAYLDRIARIDPHLHSYLHVAADSARDAARRAEQAIADGRPLGPLHGVPLAVKDLIDVADMPGTYGSPRIFGKNVPTRTATAVERLQNAGAIVLGKLQTTEFAFMSHHPDRPAARNPWAAERSPGGSSRGSAVAAAAGLASATLGTDTTASIRIPSAWCGTVGLKPTWGRVSRDGVFPLSATLDHVGPIARNVADAARLEADAPDRGRRPPLD